MREPTSLTYGVNVLPVGLVSGRGRAAWPTAARPHRPPRCPDPARLRLSGTDERPESVTPMTADPQSGIPVLYVEDPADGQKGLFGAAGHLGTRSAVLDSDELARNLSAICERLAGAFRQVHDAAGAYELECVEVTLDLTAKGEVRLIASVSSEIKGGMKLVFRRRDRSSR